MKKKIFMLFIMAAIAIAAGWNFIESKDEVKVSNLALANVEALASAEGFDTCFWNCMFDYNAHCHVFGGYPSPTYCFYYRAN